MTEELETALRRTLRDAAERAPKAPPGIGRETRHRRAPRGYSKMALTAAAVTVAIGGATVGGRTLMRGSHSASGTPVATANPSPSLRPPKKVKVPPIEKVWPKTAYREPRTLPGGREYTPLAFIDDRTVLVSTDASFEKAGSLYSYDLRDHTAKHITQVITPPNTRIFATDFTVGGGYAVWWFTGDYGTDIWSAPLSGGPARLVDRAKTPAPSRLTVDGTDAVWSVSGTGGVHRAPLAGGGPAREVPGSRKAHILTWPWIGSPAANQYLGRQGKNAGDIGFAHVKNVLTGQTLSARLTDHVSWNCGVTWCVGNDGKGLTEAQRRDGSGRRAIPPGEPGPSMPPILGRFTIALPSGGTIAVYDLDTGRMGDLQIHSGKGGAGLVSPFGPTSRLYYTTTNGGYVIVDLGAIR
ncbi:hypothetical protein [Actinomadura sp. DC4]|uniref:hypothetical protein n=1 Tax=Actinomadura sp. DC4 TaxID=3055069 RepID=UPI0025B08171|nr:hypothetical protein [Actinomadura sp. DC4]MDN3352474.1 hypothetical protein [Actinomadura sp. DC4]